MISIKNVKNTTYSYMELEKWLEENKNTEASIDKMFDFFLKKFSLEDIIYLMDAYSMPKKEIERYLELYRKSSPKRDELDFIYNLSKLYKVDEQTVIRRIQEIIIMENDEKNINNARKKQKTKKTVV